MGLSIARSIVLAFGGTIRAVDNADGGATVGFVLPVSRGSAND
jgi:signal transduction histidine kinase